MEANTINILKQCNNIREYIVNCYIYCLRHFASIHDFFYNNDEMMEARVYQLLEENLKKNHSFNYKDLPFPQNPKQALINLFVINDVIHSLDIFSYTSRILSKIDNDYYFILKKPPNPIDDNIIDDKKLRREKDRPKDISGIFNNFIVSKTNINGIKVNFKKLPSTLNNSISYSIINQKSLNIGVFSNHIEPNYNIETIKITDREHIHVDKINNEDEVIVEIEKILEFSLKEKINIIVLPELFVYNNSRTAIQNWLKTNNKEQTILLFIAGSMHNSTTKHSYKEYFNESIVFDNFGDIIFTQRKFDPFIDTSKNPSPIEHFYYMDKEIIISDTPLGRCLISICIDFKSDTYSLTNKEYFVNINFIPAWTPKTQEFREKASDYGSNFLASTFCANNTITSNDKNDKGFIYLPARDGARGIHSSFTKEYTFNINYLKIDVLNFSKS